MAHVAPALTHIDGEPVLFRAKLAPQWATWRCITCTCAMSTLLGGGMGFLLYGVW